MPQAAHRRHDISDAVWEKLEPILPGREGAWGGRAHDNRRFINAVFWIMRTGAPWRDLPPDLGGWSNTHRRFIRWRDSGVWERLLETLIIVYYTNFSRFFAQLSMRNVKGKPYYNSTK